MNDLTIRQLRYADVDALQALIGQLAEYHSDVPRVTAHDIIRLCLGAGSVVTIFVAESGTGLLGYAAAQLKARLRFGQLACDLHHLYVDTAIRGQSVGTTLVKRVEEWAVGQGCSQVTIGTHPANTSAQQFYQSLGYGALNATGPQFVRQIDGHETLAGGIQNASVAADQVMKDLPP